MASSTPVDVPVIDLGPARQGDWSARETVDEACRTTGFLTIVEHGVPVEQIDEMYAVTKAFFALPPEEKLRSAPPHPSVFRGYRAPKASALTRSLDQDSPPDLVESFVINQVDGASPPPDSDPDLAGFYHPNIWPAVPSELRGVWTRYYATMSDLARDLMRLLAVSLDLSPHWFDHKIDRHRSNLLANYYPAQDEAPLPGQLRRGAHTDYGGVTILYQDDAPGGLQVQDSAGGWVDIPAVPGSFVVNLGDLMQRWTNDRWTSTMHRVVNPPAEFAHTDRLTIPFFHIPNLDQLIEPIPTCVSASAPARHEPVQAGSWFLTKHRKTVQPAV